MRNIRRIENKDGSISWQIDWTDPAGKRKRKSYSTKKEAANALAHFHTKLAKGTYDDPAKYDRITLNDLVKKHREIYGAQKCFQTSKRFFIAHIVNYFDGDRLLKTINYSDLQAFQQHLLNTDKKRHERSELPAQKLTVATVNRIMSCCRHMFKCALSWQMIAKNPFSSGASLQLKENCMIDRFLDKSEIKRLLAASEDYLRDIIIAAINSGMRRSELLPLKWNQIKYDEGIIELPETKSGERQYVPLNADLIALFNRIKDKHKRRGIISPNVFLWKNFRGEYKPLRDCKTALISACERAGLKYGRPDGINRRRQRSDMRTWPSMISSRLRVY